MKIITDLSKLSISKDLKLDEILSKMNDGEEAVLLVTENNKLLGLITDGDVRREMVTNGANSNSYANKIMNKEPITSIDDFTKWENIFLNNDIEHLPIVDEENNIVKVVRNIKNYESITFSDTAALIVAGGLGTRMGAAYKDLPKCLIKIKDKTILERTLELLCNLGLQKIFISLNHEYQKVIDFIEKSPYKEVVEFLIEEEPLGTAGSLVSLSKKYNELNFMVVNSDIIFDLDFLKFKNYFGESKSDFIICTSQYEIEIPYGVLEKEKVLDKNFVIIEKPRIKYDVVAGIYFVKSNSLKDIDNSHIEMDELIIKIKNLNKKSTYFDIGPNWIDIGNNEKLNIAEKLTFIN
tara:strand:- start:7617 stop:8669 length:1053 start_codon:yes stop_codon:yes gene_type:complete